MKTIGFGRGVLHMCIALSGGKKYCKMEPILRVETGA